MKKLFACLLFLTAFAIQSSVFAQTGCIEIESILVDACDDGFTNPEGLNEMFRFRNGNFELAISDISIVNGWPSESINALPFNGFVQNASTVSKTVELNNTIQSCGYLLEPPSGIIPANRKVLAITSFDVTASLNSFANLSDTLYIVYHQHTGEGGGHFLNQNTGAPQQQTLRIQINGINSCYEEVTYLRASLVNATGQNTPQNGAIVNFNDEGVAAYGNTGCMAPIEPFSANWTNPGPLCQSATLINLNNYITGTSGGIWSGEGVTGNTFDPSSLTGSIAVTYTVTPTNACLTTPASVTQNILVSPGVDASFTNPQTLCASQGTLDLLSLLTGTPGGTWSGTGVLGSTVNLATLNGSIQVNYTVGSGSCTDTDFQVFTVINLQPLLITGDTVYCNGEVPTFLSTNPATGAQVNWYDDTDLVTSLSAVATFLPVANQSATYYAIQTNASCSSVLSSISVEFSFVAVPAGDTLLDYCEGDAIPMASVTSAGTVTWYADAAQTVELGTGANYQTSNANTMLYATSTSGACESEALEIEVRLTELVTANIISNGDTSLCPGLPIELVSAAANLNSWNTGSTADAITVNEPGTYTLTRVGLCNTATDQIVIAGIPVKAEFSTDQDSGYVVLPVFVSDQSINGEQYAWFLNDEPISFIAPGMLTFPDSGTFVLKLVVTNASGCRDEESTTIRVLSDKLQLIVPNVFTPNADGFNDLFQVKYNAVKTFEARVFNRWGRHLFSWDNVSAGWDGTANGEKLLSGTYFYVISGTDIKDQPFEEKGTVTLLGD
jgi:gliding motility-associated-like protein